jgi:hypothetical protein
MKRLTIGFRVNGDRLDPHFLTGPNDPAGDLASIGDEYFANFSLCH